MIVAAEAAGIAGWCLDTAVNRAQACERFRKPIGAFHDVKHKWADVLSRKELSRVTV